MKSILLARIYFLLFLTIVDLVLCSGCKKIDTDSDSLVYDICGNVYHIVTIGTQDWLDENLKTTKYQTGDPIEEVTDSIQWSRSGIGAYCFFRNDSTNSDLYGPLYNWYAVNDSRNIAPAGWHVASDEDWRTLIDHLGGDSTSGGKLKERGTNHWYSPNSGATNVNGFTALPGGYRYSNGEFRDFKSYGAWWSSTGINGSLAWRIGMMYNSGSVNRATRGLRLGFSVRCVRD
jgi:uncharacterized protein (TIGR02145 family)